MIIRNRSYPHPVLSPLGDDVSPNQFELTLGVSSDATAYYLDVVFSSENPTIGSLVEDGAAVYAVHVECRRNFYRQLFEAPSRRSRLTIDATDIVGQVEVSGFVKVQRQLTGYRIAGMHSDYGDASFTVEPGDILAVATTAIFEAYVDYDPLKNISSILTVERSLSTVDGPMKLDTSDDRIVATLSQADYDSYRDLKGDPAVVPVLANQVVVPALTHAVEYIKNTEKDELSLEREKRWFRSILNKLGELGIDLHSNDMPTGEVVQVILQLPLRRSLTGLTTLASLEAD